MKVSYGTDVGRVRSDNQDSIYTHKFSEFSGLFIVADGMGGYEGGALASSKAIEEISDYIKSQDTTSMADDEIKEVLQVAVINANRSIYDLSVKNKHLSGMGTTLVISLVTNNKLYTASVGDSRGYIYSSGKLTQITKDHSLVANLVSRGLISTEEARVHPQKNVITRAVGSEENVVADTFVTDLKADDIVLICSDGLHTMVCDDEITKILISTENDTAQKLIALANENGGKDNISVITVKICAEEKK